MKSGRFIGVMSGTSLDGVDVVLAAINENMVAQQASLTYPIPIAIKEDILAICQGSADPLAAGAAGYASGTAVCRCGSGADAQEKLKAADIIAIGCHGQTVWHEPQAMRRIRCKLATTTRLPRIPA
jgi:anhydro-N-acetylmuramic acid kinase